MKTSWLKKDRKSVWVMIDGGMVYVTKEGADGQGPAKPSGFPMPEALAEYGGGLAGFVASCLARCGVTRGAVALLLGEGVAFCEEYDVNPANARMREEQRNLAIDRALGDAGPSYIIEDLKVSDSGELSRLAVCGTRYDFLSEFVKVLKKRGYSADFATYAGAAREIAAAAAVLAQETTHGTAATIKTRAPAYSSYATPRALPDFLYGGRENRRFGRAATALCVCVACVVAVITLLPPVQAGVTESGASRYVAEVRSGEQETYYKALEQYRALQDLLPGVRETEGALDKSETAYGGLLEYLRGGLLRGGVIESVQLTDEETLTIEYTTDDVKAFEAEKQLVNTSRKMSVGEVDGRVRVGAKEAGRWRITLQVAYYSFDGKEDLYR
jgi:hypothetical protein